MVRILWRKNDRCGAFVERSLRQLEAGFDKAKTYDQKMQYLAKYAYIWNIKASIARPDERDQKIAEMQQEIEELKKYRAIAQTQQISQ